MINIGIFGCGDFLRWQSDDLKKSKLVKVSKVFDPDTARAQKFAADLGGQAAETAESIFEDDSIELVLLFVPPWVRKGLFEQAVKAGKHILTTKPLGSNADDCNDMLSNATDDKRYGVIYGRTNNSAIESLKKVFDSGEIGKLALYKQDWIHAYPAWNNWALDYDKNGGPFMDAMIHNFNAASYLIGRPFQKAAFFSDNHAHKDLMRADTEFMKADYEGGASSHLFITWAADLEVFNTEGNNREHIDIQYMVTDQGWRVTVEDGQIKASKGGKSKTFPIEPLSDTHYDRFAKYIEGETKLPSDVIDLKTAAQDVIRLRELMG